jgi:hypothetical protein
MAGTEYADSQALRTSLIGFVSNLFFFDPDTRPDEYTKALDDLHALTLTLPDGTRIQRTYIMGESFDSESLWRHRWDCIHTPECTADENRKSKFHDYNTRLK